MSIKKLRAGRVPGVTAAEYVGVHGTIFWNENTGELRLSNGETPGGLRVGFPIASSTELGGIKLGPGVILNQDNQIIIDSTGLDFSFGNLTGTVGTYPVDYYQEERQDHDYAVLGSINVDEDIVVASNGTGAVRVVGDFSVRRANGNLNGALEEEPIFRVKSDGQVQMLVPSADSTEGAVTIVGGLDGVFQAPVNTGVMFHITGIASSPDPTPSRIYNDAQNSFSAIVSRRYNGTAAAPTAVLDGEEIMRLSGTAHNGTNIPGTANQRIVYKALGNQTPSNQGGTMEFLATPLNSTTLSKVATLSSTGITLESGKVLTGNVTGKADTAGNADTVTNGVYTNGSYANPAWITSLAASKVGLGSVENTALSTSTHYIGTTSITYNRASASQTLTGVSIDGNAGTVTNGVVTTGSYSDPSWLTISKSKVGLSAVENTALSTWAGSSNITTAGTLTTTSVSDSIGNLRSIPINGKSAAYILAATDNGQMISITTGGVTVNSGVFASPYGQTISIYNNSTSPQTITQGAGVTLRLAGTTATGNRTLARYGVATIVCVASETFVMSGAGLS
jgi:hypothetical protein